MRWFFIEKVLGKGRIKMNTELIAEITDILEELDHGAEISITMGNMGHDTSEEFKMLVIEFLSMKKAELED